MSIKKTIGDNIRKFRKEIGWTQEKLGVRAGFHPNYISRLELGQENVQIETLERIAKVLKIDSHLLFL
ncbi:MAG: helix-turn-helix transcriptional regulator [bacterium]